MSASMNNNGDVIFIRNNTERNSNDGGILYKDIEARWEGKEHQKKVFAMGANIINQIGEISNYFDFNYGAFNGGHTFILSFKRR